MMVRMTWIFIVLAAVLSASSGYFAFRREAPPEPNFSVEGAVQDLGEVPVGIHELSVRLTNPSQHPRRVIGLTEICAGSYCFMGRHPNDTIVQPGETCTYKFDLGVRRPGPFVAEGVLYLEGNGLQEVRLEMRGTVAAPTPIRTPTNPRTAS